MHQVDDIISISIAAARFPLSYASFEAAPRFGGQVFQEKRIHSAFEAYMKFIDLAFCERDQRYAGEGELFVQAGNILLIAGEAVEGFGENDIEAVCPSIFQ